MHAKWIATIAGVTLALSASGAFADHTETVIGAGLGGAAGAMIGNNMGGRNDAIIWSAIGGATGAALGRSLGEPHRTVIMREHGDDDGYVVVRRRPIYYEDAPRYERHEWRHEYRRRHHEREWGDDDD